MEHITIRQTGIDEAYHVSLLIPEFEPWYPYDKWMERLSGKQSIILVAFQNGHPAGCKVGYYEQEAFYSWVGGVRPEFRGMGVAHGLATAQEELVRAAGVKRIRMKTHNRFREMLQFALRRDFYISDVEKRGAPPEWRITLYKNL